MDLKKSCRAAYSRYKIHLEEEKKKQDNNKTTSEKQIIASGIKEVQSHISELLDTCKMFDGKFITLVAEAEKKKDMNLIKEPNVKRSSDEKVEDRRKLEETLSIFLEKKKKL